MSRRWKRWIALLLLMFSVTAGNANACSVVCVFTQALASAASSHCHHEGSAPGDHGIQSQLCAFALTAALPHSAVVVDSFAAAYVPPLAVATSTGLDPPPPLKPPPV